MTTQALLRLKGDGLSEYFWLLELTNVANQAG